MMVLWAVADGDFPYNEVIITEHEDKFEEAKQWATDHGYGRFRIAEVDMGTSADFIGTIKNKGELHG